MLTAMGRQTDSTPTPIGRRRRPGPAACLALVLALATLPALAGRPAHLRVAESHDFDLLARFWSSHGQPVRPALVVDLEID